MRTLPAALPAAVASYGAPTSARQPSADSATAAPNASPAAPSSASSGDHSDHMLEGAARRKRRALPAPAPAAVSSFGAPTSATVPSDESATALPKPAPASRFAGISAASCAQLPSLRRKAY